jgi:hypothetical protein
MWRTEDEIDITKLPQLNEREVHFLWRLQYQDGPLNGLAEYQGEKVWFDFHHMDDEGLHYFYVLYRLDLERLNEVLTWKQDEERYSSGWLGPRLEGAEPIGWFTDGQNPDYYAIKVHYD